MKGQRGFYWYNKATDEGLRITTVVMIKPSGDISLIPNKGRGIVVSPSQLSPQELVELLAGIRLLADRSRQKADYLDTIASRLAV